MSRLINPYRFGPVNTPATTWGIIPLGVDVSTSSVQWIEINKLEMSIGAGGTDLCTGGTPYATSGVGYTATSDAFDSNNATYARLIPLGGSHLAVLGYTFASAKAITHIRIKTGPEYLRAPRAFIVCKSNDGGSTWTYSDIVGPLSAYTAANQVVEIAVPSFTFTPYTKATAKIWGVTFQAAGWCTEAEFRASSGGTNINNAFLYPLDLTSPQYGGVSFYTGANGGIPYGLFDQQGSSAFNGGTGRSAWMVWPTAPNPSYFAFVNGGSPYFGGGIAAFDIWWSDGVTRTNVLNITGQTGWGDWTVREYGPF